MAPSSEPLSLPVIIERYQVLTDTLLQQTDALRTQVVIVTAERDELRRIVDRFALAAATTEHAIV